MSDALEVIRDRYELLDILGCGGQGEVWLALDHQHDRRVAIKKRHIRSDADREAILSEARILLSLSPHPGVTNVRDDFFEDGAYFLVMDWIDGPSLADRVGELTFDEIVDVLRQVASALDHLHAHDPPVVHQDVKPANIVITEDGRAVLVDFGVARHRDRTNAVGSGTPAFVSPESAAGETTTPAADIYALAATAYQVLTGGLPEPGSQPDLSRLRPNQVRAVMDSISSGLSVDSSRRPTRATSLVSSLTPSVEFENFHISVDVGNIAYWLGGEGPPDFFYYAALAPPWGPGFAAFFRQLAGIGRCVLLESPAIEVVLAPGVLVTDTDGTIRAENPFALFATLTEQGDDWVEQILDQLGSERAIVVAAYDFGPYAISFAARHPDRVGGVVLVDTHARLLYADDYSWGLSHEVLAETRRRFKREWGTGVMSEVLGYGSSIDRTLLRAIAAGDERSNGGFEAAAFLVDRQAGCDVRDLLPRIEAPTLVIHPSMHLYQTEHSRYLAEHIPNAELLELESAGEPTFAGGAPVFEAVEAFLRRHSLL